MTKLGVEPFGERVEIIDLAQHRIERLGHQRLRAHALHGRGQTQFEMAVRVEPQSERRAARLLAQFGFAFGRGSLGRFLGRYLALFGALLGRGQIGVDFGRGFGFERNRIGENYASIKALRQAW